ncbi:hypothetical protein EDC96DRAFT_503801 [Choanephora cucurbitarum]|nr:hypothetical protein EDC96DRAFT_503801 [Choanephora cucurbitarum]
MTTPPEKRRLKHDLGEGSSSAPISRPPLKKRFTGSYQMQPVTPTTEKAPPLIEPLSPSPPPAPPIDINNLHQYTKAELLQRMRLEKDKLSQYEKRYDALEERYLDKEIQQSLLRIDWSLIQSEITFMTQLLVTVEATQPPAVPTRQSSLEQQKEWNDANQMAIKQLCTKVLTRLQTWSQQVELIEHNFRSQHDVMQQRLIVSDWLQNEIQDLQTSYKRGQHVLSDLQKNLESLLEQTDLLKGNVAIVKTELDAAKARLEASVDELNAVCKRQDRAKYQQETKPKQATEDIAPVQKKKKKVVPITPDHPQTTLEEHQLILSAREKELDQLKRDRQLLLREEERLLSMFSLTEDRLAETEYVKTLKLSIEHYRDRCYHLDQRRIEIERETDRITLARQQLVEQMKSEKIAQSMAMEGEMRRLENDLARIRGQRDHFQLMVEEQKTKESREREAQDKMVAFAHQGKQRVIALMGRIERLKQAQTMAGPLATEFEQFQQLKEKTEHTRLLLLSLEMMERKERPQEAEVASLKQYLDNWKHHPSILAYDQLLLESQQLSLMIEFFESNESHLLESIDHVASIYNKLEEQQKKVFDIAHKRDQAAKLQAEKMKYAQTFSQLTSDKEKLTITVQKLRATKEARQEVIKQLTEKEKALEQQVIEKEETICKLRRTIEEDKTDLEDINHLCEDYRISIEQNELMVTELQKMLKEKQKALEEENKLQQQTEESLEKLKRKWDKIAQGENPAEQQLIDECEELRALLKCSTCRQRFRTHILIRCMHTFCKHCIDARLETRQRRCPTCSEPFGANDVKNFYL